MAVDVIKDLFPVRFDFDDEGRAKIINDGEFATRNDDGTKTWIYRNGSVAIVGSSTLYTVPAGKVFFLTNCHLGIRTNDLTEESRGRISFIEGAITRLAIEVVGESAADNKDMGGTSSNQSFIPPIKVLAGKALGVHAEQNGTKSYGQIQGWIEDAK